MANQPGVGASDFQGAGHAPHLRKWVSGADSKIRSSYTVSDVRGIMRTSDIVDTLEKSCGAGTLHIDASSEFMDTEGMKAN